MCSTAAVGSSDHQSGAFRIANDTSAVKLSPLFAGVTPAEYTSISASAHVKTYSRGEVIYFKGDIVQQVMLLTTGSIKITQFGASGTEVILNLRVTGDVLGATSLLSRGRHAATAQTFRLCRALTWDTRVFKTMLDRSPILHQNMARILENDIEELEQRFQEVATEKVGTRVAHQLLRLQDKIGRQVRGEGIEVSLSRQELAQMTGTTLFTVSRLLSSWELLGIVKANREAVIICDTAALRSAAEACDLSEMTKPVVSLGTGRAVS